MGSHSHSAVEDLHGFTRQVYVQFLVDQRVWHAVKVALDFDVVVDVDASGFPFSELITGGRKRLQCRPVQLGE